MCLGFDIKHIKFKYTNGYMVVSTDEGDIFWDMYWVARDMRGWKAIYYLKECKNRFLERLLEDPKVLLDSMPEFFANKIR